MGETETSPLEGMHKDPKHQDAGEGARTYKSLGQIYILVLEGLLQRQGAAVVHCGDKDTGSRSSWMCS